MIKELLSLYNIKFPKVITYMIQASEYDYKNYFMWLNRVKDYNKVNNRKQLVKTKASDLILRILYGLIIIQILAGLTVVVLGFFKVIIGGEYYGLAIIISYPIIWPYFMVIALFLAQYLIINPRNKELSIKAEKIFKSHPGIVIAVMGSYGKTSMKEYLLTVLSQSKNVAATPDNKNVAISHARFAEKLTGKEDIVILEYGEGKNGDISRFAQVSHPSMAIVTGLAPVHQDHYKDLSDQASDLLSITKFIKKFDIYVNGDDKNIKHYFGDSDENFFNDKQVLGWKISNKVSNLSGTSFTMIKGKKKISLTSHVVGLHQISYLAFVVAISDQLGLTSDQISKGIALTKPFEHRMQPYRLSEAYIIDDTYNGNLEGIRAGLALLESLDCKRKIYVTPGLVDQGKNTSQIHHEIGQLIAKTNPDIVVLMKNSVTNYIIKGLNDSGFKNQLIIEDNPLEFYLNLKVFVAKDDVVLMQNDWPDTYQ